MADFGPLGILAIIRRNRPTRGENATTYPVNTIMHICMPKERSDQKPSPQNPTHSNALDGVNSMAAANTISVRRQATTNELGIQRIDQRVRPAATRSRMFMRRKMAAFGVPATANTERKRMVAIGFSDSDCVSWRAIDNGRVSFHWSFHVLRESVVTSHA